MDLINDKFILGIGEQRDKEDDCSMVVGETRKTKNAHPGSIFIAIPCPDGGEECIINEYGSLFGITPSDGKKSLVGIVVDSCPAEAYVDINNSCMKCPGSGGCKKCSSGTSEGLGSIKCTECYTEFGYVEETTTNTDGTTNILCSLEKCSTQSNMYWNGSECTEGAPGCDTCELNTCAYGGTDKVMKIDPATSERTCIDAAVGCGIGWFTNDQNICMQGDSSCTTCNGKGSHRCTSCSDSSKMLKPIEKLRIKRNNMKAEFEVETNSQVETEVFKYEIDSNAKFEGNCEDNCNVKGMALWNNNGICQVGDAYGCDQCDSSGTCTACSRRLGLSLIDDPNNQGSRKCAKGELADQGCRLCKDDDNTQCKMGEFPNYSLQTVDGKQTCVRLCDTGFFSKEMTLGQTEATHLMRDLKYNVCTACDSSCTDCNKTPDKCLLCSGNKVANMDGSGVSACQDGTFELDGKCLLGGPYVATCEIDSTTMENVVLSCKSNYFISPSGKKCVLSDQCGEGMYADVATSKCKEGDTTKCSACKGSSTFCTECEDTSKFVSSDGEGKDNADEVTCNSNYFKVNGICMECDVAGDDASGCTGPGPTSCKKCSSEYKVLSTNTDSTSTTYKCGQRCQALAEEATINGETKCNLCLNDSSRPIFDFKTGTCISEATGCPIGTVLTSVNKLPMEMDIDTDLPNSSIKVGAKCDEKCETCIEDHFGECVKGIDSYFTNTVTLTNGSTRTSCSSEGGVGKFPDSNKNGVNDGGITNGAKCNDASTCERGLNGYFYLEQNQAITCTDTCPDGTFGNKLTGKCEACSSPCVTGDGSALSGLSGEAGSGFEKLFAPSKICFDVCPLGTYESDNKCLSCNTNIINCESNGESLGEAREIEGDSSCNKCLWSPGYCVTCANGKLLAPFGRCVDTCPDNTIATDVGNSQTECKEGSTGCLKCVKESESCQSDSSSTTTIAKCIKGDKDLGFFLFQGSCVKECPNGTYPDKMTGWGAKGDGNCGSGGGIDRFTCKSCPLPNMISDPETGKCVCDTSVTASWAEDWSYFTINIEATSLKFRDIDREDKTSTNIKNKVGRIGNEGSIFDDKSKLVLH